MPPRERSRWHCAHNVNAAPGMETTGPDTSSSRHYTDRACRPNATPSRPHSMGTSRSHPAPWLLAQHGGPSHGQQRRATTRTPLWLTEPREAVRHQAQSAFGAPVAVHGTQCPRQATVTCDAIPEEIHGATWLPASASMTLIRTHGQKSSPSGAVGGVTRPCRRAWVSRRCL